MGIAQFEQAVTLVQAYPERAEFIGPREEHLIALAEGTLNVPFPPTYRRFLLELGVGSFGSEEFYGIIDSDFEHSGVPDAIWYTLTERSRSGLPEPLVIISELGDGDLFALDTSSPDAEGECPVVVWLPGANNPGDILEHIAPDFGTFFLNTVQSVLNRR